MSIVPSSTPRNAWEKASLVLGNGFLHKTGKLQALKPLSALGEFDFSRVGDTATRVNESGLIEEVASNIPRIDCRVGKKILLEPQKPNSLTWSEDLTNSNWLKSNCIINANVALSPRGNATADKISETNDDGLHDVFQLYTATGNDVISFYAKKETDTRTHAYILTGGGLNLGVFDLVNGIVTRQVFGNAFIEDAGDGYWRCELNVSLTGLQFARFGIAKNGLEISYTGIAGAGIFAWGFQCEPGSRATSYIKTMAAASTRGADICSKSGISSVIGQTEGTLFIKASVLDLTTFKRFSLNSGSFLNSVFFDWRNDGTLLATLIANGVVVFQQDVTPSDPLNINSYAFSYKNNSIVVFVNGQMRASGNQSFVFSSNLSRLDFSLAGNEPFFGAVDNAITFPIRMSDSALQELTSL